MHGSILSAGALCFGSTDAAIAATAAARLRNNSSRSHCLVVDLEVEAWVYFVEWRNVLVGEEGEEERSEEGMSGNVGCFQFLSLVI